jgi:hypothetical protein
MDSRERWRRAGCYAAVTALVAGLALLILAVNATQANYLKTAGLAFVVSMAILAGLTLFWFWLLKLRGQ